MVKRLPWSKSWRGDKGAVKMLLDFASYKDKVMGCWSGKNIGGVLGAPYECQRQFNDIEFYTQDLSQGPPPNDDLDLQIIWLAAVERFGRQVSAQILGEYWLSFVVPNWVEYGTGKANMVAGLMPPLSGHFNNGYRNSCGCFIRSEIWACLAPGHPEIAVRYAYEDGIVDHSGDGVYGEVFCAALESAAFVENDARKLIGIGLSYIPEDCAVARCVNTAIKCYDEKLPLIEARKRIHNEAPGTFGVISRRISQMPTEGETMPLGTPGFDCPENIGFMIAGWLYGEGDFGKALCAAVNCGEDTDCTAATLGAIMGIISGTSNLPEKWTKPLNDKIATLCINRTAGGVWVPDTVTQLADRVLRVMPSFLGVEHCDLLTEGGYTIHCQDPENLLCPEDDFLPRHAADEFPRGLSLRQLIAQGPHVMRFAFPTHTVAIDCGEDIFFDGRSPRKIKLSIINNDLMKQQMWCRVKAYAPENIRFVGGNAFKLQLNTLYGDRGEAVFEIDASDYSDGEMEIIFDISLVGRHSNTPVKALLLRRPTSMQNEG
jgi:ADP-ribosylglycohydrolase